ncbi:hypothetical protein [Streptomyces fuscichromogenes]|uniref:Uncharacterized protein n=1 Tax=Streptomyces fuscichromogenes TaxID=1324013 RepID=A0A917XB14_9ACTN|nr:hypothetical protein GCM10011578_024520 [Streptomyces fuscichromogenes]
MNRDQDIQLEKERARYGLLAVVVSNLAIAAVAVFGVWRLNGNESVIIGVLTAAFTAVSSMTTAYLGIKAVSNTAKSIASSAAAQAPQAPAAPVPVTQAPVTQAPVTQAPVTQTSAGETPAAPAAATPATPAATPPTQRGQ